MTATTYQPLPTQDSPVSSSESLKTPPNKLYRHLLLVFAFLFAAFAGYSLFNFNFQSTPSLPSKTDLSQPSDMPHSNGKYSVG